MKKEKLRIIGIMTGTSMDAIDVAIVDFYAENEFSLLAYEEVDYPTQLKDKIHSMIDGNVSLADLSQLNFYLSKLYSDAVITCLDNNNIDKSSIDLLGIHGQTIWHQPKASKFLDNDEFETSSTYQLGSGLALSALLELPVASNFREADIALGGQGAPLIPIFDYHFLSSDTENIITLNIGGISNITYIPKSANLFANKSEVIAFDTGAGNSLIDMAMTEFYNKDYDKNGETAFKGKLIDNLFDELKNMDYISKQPPKSTGKEEFGVELFMRITERYKSETNEDIVHTLSLFTASSIAENIKLFANQQSKIIVSGGGVKNKFIMEALEVFLPQSIIISSDKMGVNSSAKEAICFAYLAYRLANNLPSNIKSVTGASKEIVLGSLSKCY